MKRAVQWLSVMVMTCWSSAMAAEVDQLGEGLVNPGYVEKPAWFKQSFLDLEEDVAEATEVGRRLLLYFYQDGCPYCSKWIEDLHDEAVADKVQRGFDVVSINLWGDREVVDLQGEELTEKQLSESLKVMFTPTLIFLNESGEGVLRMNGYYPPHQFAAVLDYVSSHKEQETPFAQYYAKLNPAAPSPTLHHQPGWGKAPLDLGQLTGSGRPKLVLFEQKRCASCDELHLDILQRPELKQDLAQFDVALLDRWGKGKVTLPSGRRISERKWAESLNIQFSPTLLFLDDAGGEVFRTEAYLKAFHTQSAMRYVLNKRYKDQPHFQRYVQERADALHDQGIEFDLMD